MDGANTLQTHIRNNALKSALLVAGFPLVLPAVFYLFLLVVTPLFGQPDPAGVAWLFAVALLYLNVAVTLVWLPIGYFTSQRMIDDATGARTVTEHEEPRIHSILEGLCRRASMRLPVLRVIDTEVLNAFACGLQEGQFSVVVTRGLADALTDDELEAVLAHELTHIRNRDVLLLTIGAILLGAVPIVQTIVLHGFLALVAVVMGIQKAVFAVLPTPGAKLLLSLIERFFQLVGKGAAYVVGQFGHLGSLVIHFAISRSREFMADAGAVEITSNPEAMISALQRISGNCLIETGSPGVAAMLIENPITGLFATHPPVEERIAAIRKYAAQSLTPRVKSDGQTMGGAAIKAAPTGEPLPEAISPLPAASAPPEPPAHLVANLEKMLTVGLERLGPQSSAETRQAFYSRATSALAAQLKGGKRVYSDEDMVAAEGALDAAIARVEAGNAGRRPEAGSTTTQ